MPIRGWAAALCGLAALLPLAGRAEQPLSVIDWLNQQQGGSRAGHVLLEPPVAETGMGPEITVTPLQDLADPIGLVPGSVTGLPPDLWENSAPETLARLIADVPVIDTPAMQALLYTLLLTEARAPAGPGAEDLLLQARIDRLMALGATDPAQTLARVAGPERGKALFARWFDATLLTGDEDQGCTVLAGAPHLAPSQAARIFCLVRRGDWATAALTLEAAHALKLLPPETLALLDRFLSPEMFEGLPPLPRPARPDPLSFRLFEAIGERLPTAALPRAFATADLRDVAGWKAQLEAAERLARSGALAPNMLLGLYTERRPAASGGIWDRVAALQRFETALGTGSAEAVAKTLPPVWRAMRAAGLEVPFATLFGDALALVPAADPATADLVFRIRLLSPGYEAAARDAPDAAPETTFLAALARGIPGLLPPPDERARAIADGFASDAQLPPGLRAALDAGQLGEVILEAMILFDRGARGNLTDLTRALATLRAVGLEDSARRAALQLMLLERGAQ